MRTALQACGALCFACSATWLGFSADEIDSPITMEDFKEAILRVQTSVGKNDLEKYKQWMNEFGSQ